jgi:hypothetical protein
MNELTNSERIVSDLINSLPLLQSLRSPPSNLRLNEALVRELSVKKHLH